MPVDDVKGIALVLLHQDFASVPGPAPGLLAIKDEAKPPEEPEEAEATDAVTNGEVHEMEKGDLPMTIEANLLSFVFLKRLL